VDLLFAKVEAQDEVHR
jgi:hypothetical protein